MKKLLAIALVAVMSLGALVSCGMPTFLPNGSPTESVTDESSGDIGDNGQNADSDVNDENSGNTESDEISNGNENIDDNVNDENTDNGNADSGNTDSGNNDNGNTDSGNTDSGNTDSGNTDSGNTDSGNTDSGNDDNGNTDGGNTDSGNTDGGNTDGGNTDGGNTDGGNTDADDSGEGDEDTHDHEEEFPATCQTESKCLICGESFGGLDEGNHEGEEKWESTKDGHKKVYSCCGAVVEDQTGHTFVNSKCSVCGYECNEHEADGDLCKTCKAFVAHTYSNNKCVNCGLDLRKAEIAQGDTIYFGSYPQSAVSASFTAGTWVEHNKAWYCDITENGVKYRGVKTSESGAVSWFKYDPIKWVVLEVKDGKALIISDLVIDAQAYQKDVTYAEGDDKYHKENSYNPSGTLANNYKDSTIRNWLITTFYNTAFGDLQKEVIAMTVVDNDDKVIGDYTNGNKFFCEDTEDKIFLLSKGEVKMYDSFNENGERMKKVTDYAKIQGAYSDENGGDWWWLRTPTYTSEKTYGSGNNAVTIKTPNKSDTAHNIKVDGSIWSTVVTTDTGGVVPAMWINI